MITNYDQVQHNQTYTKHSLVRPQGKAAVQQHCKDSDRNGNTNQLQACNSNSLYLLTFSFSYGETQLLASYASISLV